MYESSPRLEAPAPIDDGRPFASYLKSVEPDLQGPWGTFLEDCRLRLPPTHALNQTKLSTTVDLITNEKGLLLAAGVAQSSGNAEFKLPSKS
jgi:hypothetical protein